MSILDNEGHDPNGLGNRPSLGSVERAYNDGYAASRVEIERLRRHLDGRDAFIVAKGLWDEFVAQLPASSQQLEDRK